LVTGRMFTKYADYAWTTKDAIVTRILNICNDVIDMAHKNRSALTALLDVMLILKKEGLNFSDVILKRTVKLHILFKRLLRLGISLGEIVVCDINKVTHHIVIMLESFSFQLAFLDDFNVEEAKEVMANYLELLKPQEQRFPNL
ncbi:MAG: TetR/AcrR family transcriptional regulator, partial [Sphaerochaetaceae bacterium]